VSPPDESPGSWQAATHLTRGGDWELRERADGRFDLRLVGEEEPCTRAVGAAYVHAEFRFTGEAAGPVGAIGTGRWCILYGLRRPHHGGGTWYTHLYPFPALTASCGKSGEQVFTLRVRDLAPGESSRYWAWWEVKDRAFRYVWPSRAQVEMCFPDGGTWAAARGRGEIVNVFVEEVEGT
jgi:hypothetical protein